MNNLLLPLLLLVVVAVPLVLGTRKQKKQQAAQQDLQKSIAPGDRVMTTSGLYGTVADASGDDTIDIEIAPGVVTTWLRIAVREKVQPAVETDETEVETDSDDTVGGVASTTAAAPAHESIEDAGEKSGAQIAPPLEHGKK
ncbi:preprotein translocase subunit YajC [Amycolatopsis sp. NPDC023774]|uniref:preprotein translocase subunit YajC n=1 Tax=Amycolatopsis sp. NPDC023774 TaxID=3155015 RepID=UPI00340FB9D0